jgi:hypothetical protein
VQQADRIDFTLPVGEATQTVDSVTGRIASGNPFPPAIFEKLLKFAGILLGSMRSFGVLQAIRIRRSLG